MSSAAEIPEMTVSEHLSVMEQRSVTPAGDDAESTGRENTDAIHGRSGQESARQIMVRRKRSLCLVHDPRVYQTTVKEFVKDKKGNLCKAVLVKLESKKDEKTGRNNDGSGRRKRVYRRCRSGSDRSRIPWKPGLCDKSIWCRSE